MAYTGLPQRTGHSGGRLGHSYERETFREQILDQIAYVNALDTPLLSSLGKVPFTAERIEWLMDDIAWSQGAVQSENEVKQFFTDTTALSDANADFRTRAANVAHYITKEVFVTDRQRRVSEMGVGDEYAQQLWKKTIHLAKDFENALMFSVANDINSGTMEPTGHSSGVASMAADSKMMGLVPYAKMAGGATSDKTVAGRTIPFGTGAGDFNCTWKTNTTAADMTVDEFHDEILAPYWNLGGEASQTLFMCGHKFKRLMGEWGMVYSGSGATLSAEPMNQRNIPAAAKKLIDTIDVYESQFGTIYINRNRYMSSSQTYAFTDANYFDTTSTYRPDRGFLMFEPRYVKVGVGTGFTHLPMSKRGLQTAGAIYADLSLVVRNPKILAGGENVVV